MADQTIYQDIAKRTGGDIYIGVVGPVRTGKSTFIHRFLDSIVLPNIENDYDRTRTMDEMPQSAGGKTVMTTEPKFVPDESVKIRVGGDTELNVRMIDCVGYMVDGALGGEEDGAMRMVKTPWAEEEIPFSRAAEIGTGKVIGEHSTIGMLVTTDGTVCGIPRENYIPAEERVAAELKALGKPFAIILNSATPEAESAHALAAQLEEKYGVPVALVSCEGLDKEDIRGILSLVLGEFPVRSLTFTLPSWTGILPTDHPLRRSLLEKIDAFTDGVHKLGDIEKALDSSPGIERVAVNAGDGTGEFTLPLEKEVYYRTMNEFCGLDITDERSLIATVCDLAEIKKKYEKVESALKDVEEKGYGIVMPAPEALELEEPRLIKNAGGWGVKVSARADSIHMIRAGIKAELNPVVGTEEQSEEVAKHLMTEFEEDPKKVWESNIFGKSLYELVNEGMKAKLTHIPDDSREKLGETLEKILNDGSNGLICILL